jgi:hypothetical protein
MSPVIVARFSTVRAPSFNLIATLFGRVCVEEASTNIWGHHLWFANMRMRAFVDEHQLVGLNVALCRECHAELSEQILANYMELGKFDEGARFPGEFGRAEEVR